MQIDLACKLQIFYRIFHLSRCHYLVHKVQSFDYLAECTTAFLAIGNTGVSHSLGVVTQKVSVVSHQNPAFLPGKGQMGQIIRLSQSRFWCGSYINAETL